MGGMGAEERLLLWSTKQRPVDVAWTSEGGERLQRPVQLLFCSLSPVSSGAIVGSGMGYGSQHHPTQCPAAYSLFLEYLDILEFKTHCC
jgi:hypothetical protein